MRAPLNGSRRHVGDASPLALGLGALALAATATLGLGGSAAAGPQNVELLVNGVFDSVPWIWDCQHAWPANVPHEHWMEGRPTDEDTAGCTQRAAVLPNSTYTLRATVRGPFAFVGVRGTGTGTGEVATWSSGADWNDLSTTVTTGPDTTSVTVYFHGWYGQDPYRVRWISLVGPGVPPNPCGPATGTATGPAGGTATAGGGSPTPTPSSSCVRTPIGF
ncbi:hypothetical protein ACIQBJ_13920 [Kitasatospora sp. NPDC088391]|uniref:hypothetical protein n=1 Tax=Kitasatospora sp. NPDC088391 TaxID=3364074 RepID=UPI003821C84A